MTERSTGSPRPMLSRWWRNHVLAGVDYQKTLDRVLAESGFDGRYAFMIVISAGISILGLLLPSSAVLIGAMLISPLMMPIMGLGFGLAVFDLSEIRRAGIALLLGSLIAIVLSAAFVAVSPIQAVTTEIAIRTKPNLFDLLVAMLSALMGGYALIRGHGGAVVGVAIAIALMPPLAVVGFGIATWNATVFWGSLLLFLTNLVTMALTAALVARVYGFGAHLSPAQTRLQATIIVAGLVALAVPMGLALRHIAWETLAQRQIRDAVIAPFERGARISQIEINFDREPIVVRAAVLTPRLLPNLDARVRGELQESLGRPIDLHIDQINVGQATGASEAAQITAAQTEQRRSMDSAASDVVRTLQIAAGVDRDAITVDREARSAIVAAAPLPGAGVAAYRALESRVAAGAQGWRITLIPPVAALPDIAVADDKPAAEPLAMAIWAAQRIKLPIGVAGSGAPTVVEALTEAGVDARVTGNGTGAARLRWLAPEETN